MTLYTRYDFVPGDKVIFCDDLAGEEMGEFPSRWGLKEGVFEIANIAGQKWILCTNRGTIHPKLRPGPLPDKYTVEMEIFSNADKDGWYRLQWVDAKDQKVGELAIGYSRMTGLWIQSKRLADKNIETLPKGKHVLRVMATKSSIKCYVDQERIANVPKTEGFAPVRFEVHADPYFQDNKHALIGSFRYAEGGKTLKEQLDETGRVVTHGILFDSGSDRIKAESYKTLSNIAGLLTENPTLRVSIEGHTDSDGADVANMTLSQKRAAAVKTYVVDAYQIDAARMETKGWGESKPIDDDGTAEGKANNRRVELVKL
jgi:outer membrane protein OmpA-like peptidoglycan-associated protein